MSFSEFVSLMFLIVFGFILTTEVYAALSALGYTRRIVRNHEHKHAVFWLRYTWGSVFFHETFCRSMNREPAYRLEYIVLVWAIGQAAWGLATLAGVTDLTYVQVLNMQTTSCAGFFLAAYGRVFYSHRQVIAFQQVYKTWS